MIATLSAKPSIVNMWLAELRDQTIQQDAWRFRENIQRIGAVLALEISKTLEYTIVTVATPLAKAEAQQLTEQPILATILRAGLPMHEGMLEVFDHVDNAFLAEYRKHDASGKFIDVASGYITSPDPTGRTVILCNPMLATGSSIIRAIEMLREVGEPGKIHTPP